MNRIEFEKFKAKFYEVHKGLKDLTIKYQGRPEGKEAMDGLDKLEHWFLDFIEKIDLE